MRSGGLVTYLPPSSSQAPNPGEWLPDPGSAQPIACDAQQARPGRVRANWTIEAEVAT
jgi:hypothetical protein